jgi:hypothetical protein
VSQIVRPRRPQHHASGRPTTRIERVATGWTTDNKYTSKPTGPRRLMFAGRGNTFSKLVREYSGDIPPKAMLTEMTRLGLVHKDKRGYLLLVRSDVVQSRITTRALKAAIPWVGFLARASTGEVGDDLTSYFQRVDLKFSSKPQIFAAVRELRGRHAAFVTSLEQLGSRIDGKGRYALNISVAIAATNPRISSLRRQLSIAKNRTKART